MKAEYQPQQIEQQIQEFWLKNQSFKATEDSKKEKFYCLSMLPYPSGELHMGHVRNYTIGDVIARYQKMAGKNVLQPMGWDAFGLPAENAALKHHRAPSEWTYSNIASMRKQFLELGLAIDWSREITTSKPEFYRWEQWLFLQMYKKGLAYKKNATVNWDPVDQTVLANEQVVEGRGWRSGAIVEQREIPQWFLKITAYSDELLAGLDKLPGWPEKVKTMQRNWIGRSEGIEIDFALINSKDKITIFTTRPDTLFGVTYLAISPQHPLAIKLAEEDPQTATFFEQLRHTKVAEADFAKQEKKGIATPYKVIHPISGEILPVWIANFVLMEYGSGAVMSVPAHDQRDYEFAKHYDLPLKTVIKTEENWNYSKAALTTTGTLIHSSRFDGLTSAQAFIEIAEELEKNNKGRRQIHYRLHDWGVSRQRYWGTPIPIIYCEKCGTVPAPEKDLPVLLPENLKLEDPRSPLTRMPEFYETTCPQCGGPARRETDTFDTFMESSWYYARYTCPQQNQKMLDEKAKYWLPVDQYVGGVEHAVMHLLYARFIYKVMRDEGLINSSEPFTQLLTQGMVLNRGVKMSKSLGNVVTPTEIINKYGADTARLFSMFAAPPELSLEWSDAGVEGSFRFLKRLYNYAYQARDFFSQNFQQDYSFKNAPENIQQLRKNLYENLLQATYDMQRKQFNTVVSAAMKIFNLLPPLETESKDNFTVQFIHENLSITLRILAPITPHITQYLWKELDFGTDILQASWPAVDENALKVSIIKYIIQVNGKRRGEIAVAAEANKEEIEKLILAHSNVKQFTDNKQIKKVIVVPNKLINIVISDSR